LETRSSIIMTRQVLVLGSTGNVGAPLVQALLARGVAVRAASRKAVTVPGATPVIFDFADPATYLPALDGAQAAYVLAPTGTLDWVGAVGPFVSVAAERGVKIVLQTAIGVDSDDSIPARQLELAVIRSGARHVILRPNWFSDNFHLFWRHDILAGRIAVPAGEGRTAFIDARDIAAAAAGALLGDGFDGKAFNLSGPDALSYADAAALAAKVAGRPVAYTPIDDATFITNLTAAGVPQAYAAFLAAIFHPVREGWTAAVTSAVEDLSGQKPRSLATYFADHAAMFRG
jgi:uncharacterized protein YbjT (DUF2867 family)